MRFEFELRPSKVNSGQKYSCCFKAHFLFYIQLQSYQGLTLTFEGHLDPKKITIRKAIYDFLFDFYWHHLSISYHFRDIRLQSFQGFTLTFDLWRSSEVKKLYTIRKAIYDYLFNCYGHLTVHLSISYRFEIFDFKVFRVWHPPLTPKGHLGSKKFIPFERPYLTSYLTSMDTVSLSCTVLEIFDFKVFRVWPWPLTPRGHLGSKNCISLERLYMNSYLTSIDTIFLSHIVLEIFDFKVFRVWPWPLTPEGHLGSKNFIPFERP